MSADLGMAVTLMFWIATLALASTGRGRGRYARSETRRESGQDCVVYPLVPRARRDVDVRLPEAS